MSNVTIIVLVLVVPVTVAGGAAFVWLVARRLRAVYGEVEQAYATLQPGLQQLQSDAEVARRELDGLNAAMARLSEARTHRAGRGRRS